LSTQPSKGGLRRRLWVFSDRPLCAYAVLAAVCLEIMGLPRSATGAELLGVHFDTGAIYRISSIDGSFSVAGSTGIPHLGSLEMGSDNLLYSFSTGEGLVPMLYRIDPVTYAASPIGPLGGEFIFEGSIAFAPNGTAYGTSQDDEDNPQLFTIDLNTGARTQVGTISGGVHDFNALAWRGDGMLVGLDRVSNALLTIDPITAVSTLIAPVDPVVGAVGGMAVLGNTGFFTTSGPGLPSPGSNELYSFDLFTGVHSLIGGFSPGIEGVGISGLAVPEPTSLLLLIFGAVPVLRRRKVSAR